MKTLQHFLNREDGSLPLAMLAVMIVTTLTIVATTSMVMGQTQTRRDQQHEQALYVAEQGLDQLTIQVESRAKETPFSIYTGGNTASSCNLPGYCAAATINTTLDQWELRSTGVSGEGRKRTLEVVVPRKSPFTHNPMGRQDVRLNGNNAADSYRSGTFTFSGSTTTFNKASYESYLDASNGVIASTGRGFFATEGPLQLNGQTFANSDGAQIYYAKTPGYNGGTYVADSLPGATGICLGVTQTCAAYGVPSATPRLEYFRDRIQLRPVVPPATPVNHYDGAGKTLAAGTTYVFRSAKLYASTVIQGTPANPTVIYLTGQLTAEENAMINFEPDPSPTVGINGIMRPKPAAGLLIYSVASGPAVQFPQGVQFSGGIYAPNGSFNGGAQGQIFGGLVADVVTTTGGWRFHYDQTLAEMRTATLKASSWVELSG